MSSVSIVQSEQKPTKRPRPRSAATNYEVALARRIRSREARVAIVGQGYVGLPLATGFADLGFTVTGLDCDDARVAGLNAGRSCTPDVDDARLGGIVNAGRYQATSDPEALRRADVIIICVPTPLRKSREPVISYVVAAAQDVAERFRPGQLVILESTTYP